MNRKVNKITIEILTNSHLNEHVNDMQVKFEKVKTFVRLYSTKHYTCKLCKRNIIIHKYV